MRPRLISMTHPPPDAFAERVEGPPSGKAAARPLARRLAVAFVSVVGITVATSAGFWQLDRAAQKDAWQAALERRAAMPALDNRALSDVLRATPSDTGSRGATGSAALASDGLVHRRVVLQGRWLAVAPAALAGRSMGGRHGFVMVAPFVADGVPVAFAVQRGFVPLDPGEPNRLPRWVPPEPDSVTLVGQFAPMPGQRFELGRLQPGKDPVQGSGSDAIRHNLDLSIWSMSGVRVEPGLTVLQTAAASPDGLQRDWTFAPSGREKHLGYSFQWFAIAFLIAFLYVWFDWIRPGRRDRARA